MQIQWSFLFEEKVESEMVNETKREYLNESFFRIYMQKCGKTKYRIQLRGGQ